MGRVRVRHTARLLGVVLAVAATSHCTHDYDRFDLSGAGGGSASGGSSPGGSSGAGRGGAGGLPGDGSAGRPLGDATSCGAGEKLCSARCVPTSDPSVGCDPTSCAPCSVANGTPACNAGQCAVGTCNTGFGDCNSSASDGCEQATTGNSLHCGACGRACSGTNVTARECSGNACTSSCKLGFGNCNRPTTGSDDGCELDTSADSANCGGCGNDCSQQGAVGNGLTCATGRCGCTSDAQCQTNTSGGTATCNTTSRNCVCGGLECKPGEACRRRGNDQECSCNGGGPCSTGALCCRTASPGCKTVLTDVSNCGACGRTCPTGFICSNGECACNAAADCNGGSPGQCNAGVCSCGGASDAGTDAASATTCAPGERCLGDSSCG